MSYGIILNSQTFVNSSAISSFTSAGEGDLYIDENDAHYIGKTNGTLRLIGKLNLISSNDGSVSITENGNNIDLSAVISNWLLSGNSDATAANFIGTTNDTKMEFRSNNTSILQLGRRQTLGLTQNFPDYNDNDQPLVLLNGDGVTSALQFTASGASFYKPMFFTTTNGSFRLKGSSGITDFFEIGSAGPSNDGRLEFIIGDDGFEPIVFKRYDYRNGQFHTELFRVQGSNNTANALPRFGINVNPQQIPVDTDFDDASSSLNAANSTLQVGGSVSVAILRTTGNLTLGEQHHTIIITGSHNLTLPSANSCTGRFYIIKNSSNSTRTISSYRDNQNNNQNTIQSNSTYWLQSDGIDWQQIN